ncbi:MAG TPA: trypsin-like peptidase domain-containing protein [Candidatus Polarisedimenticolia bacterium]|nr:trypsin-like peptidase domain-containing protein [Candidatus Polarisedimenticolia bacterium]
MSPERHRRRFFHLAALVAFGVAAFVLVSGPALARKGAETGYDDAFGGVEGAAPALRVAGSSVFPLLTEVTFDTGESSPTRATVEGIGTLLFGRYVLTVAHAITLDHLETTVPTARGRIIVPLDGRPVARSTWLLDGDRRVPLRLVASREDVDIALLLAPETIDLPGFPYPVGDSEALELADRVALLESDPVAGVLFRPGAVAALRGSAVVHSVSRNDQVFLMSLGLTSGESGAPVVAPRRGHYELVGLAQGTYVGPRQLAWAIRIGPALEALKRADSWSPDLQRFLHLCGHDGVASLGSGAP